MKIGITIRIRRLALVYFKAQTKAREKEMRDTISMWWLKQFYEFQYSKYLEYKIKVLFKYSQLLQVQNESTTDYIVVDTILSQFHQPIHPQNRFP
jgi:hypothetical protein